MKYKISSLTKGKLVVLLLCSVVVLGASLGTTLSLWSDDTTADISIITSGNLDIEKDGTTEWTLISTDVPAAPKVIAASTYLAAPGDTFEVKQNFITKLVGDNVKGDLTVSWATAPTLPTDVTATYKIVDAANAVVIPSTTLGTAATAENFPLADTPYTMVINLRFTKAKENLILGSDETTSLGSIKLTLNQSRQGIGFTP